MASLPGNQYSAQMKGRHFLLFLIWSLALAFLPSCKGGKNKAQLPVDFVYDRTICEECKMAISDPRYAAEVIEPSGKPHFFDDSACAILWLSKHPNIGKVRIWVKDVKTRKWVEANKAYWIYGDPHTPMGYGYAATATPVKGALKWDTVRKYVLIGKTLVNENLVKRLDIDGPSKSPGAGKPSGLAAGEETHR